MKIAHLFTGQIFPILREIWLALLLGSFLILYGLGWGLPDNHYIDKSFHADENAAVWAVEQISFPKFNPHWFYWGTALFYQVYLIKEVFTLGGLIDIDNYWIIVMGRLVVYASAMGAITLTFLLGRKLFDTPTARLAATILAVLPGFVINSHYFKVDIPMTFWTLAALLTAYLLIFSANLSYVVPLGLLVGYTASIKYTGVALFPAGLIAVLMASQKSKLNSCIAYLSRVAVGFIFGTPYFLLQPKSVIDVLHLQAVANVTGNYYHLARPPAWIDYPLNVFPYALTPPILLLGAMALIYGAIQGGRKMLLIWAFALSYYALLSMDNFRYVRYTVPILPLLALFVAYFIASVRKVAKFRLIANVGFIALSSYAFVFSLSYVRGMAQVDPRIHASIWITEHIQRDTPIPVIETHYLNVPQIQLLGYKKLEVGYSIAKLQQADSPYLIFSEFGPLRYQDAVKYFPQQQNFFDFVEKNYVEVEHFENSQRLLGVDSKAGTRLPLDWLIPNPRITILKRLNHETDLRLTSQQASGNKSG